MTDTFSEIKIRPCEPADCIPIAALGRSIWGDWSNGPPLTRQYIDMGHPVFVASNAANDIVGYCVGTSEADNKTGYVLSVTINPQYQQRGIGDALLKEVVASLKKQGRTSINTRVSDENVFSKKLFTRNGFTEIKREKNYYDPIDMYLLYNLKL